MRTATFAGPNLSPPAYFVDGAQEVVLYETTDAPRHRTRTGYGSKIPTPYACPHNGRLYRCYVDYWGLPSSLYIVVAGQVRWLLRA